MNRLVLLIICVCYILTSCSSIEIDTIEGDWDNTIIECDTMKFDINYKSNY